MMIFNVPQRKRAARVRFAALSLPMFLTAGLVAGLSGPGHAQEASGGQKTPAASLEKIVSVDAENATLASVITTLMQNVGANYTLDNSLRTIRVTAHLHNVRLDIVLNILLRNANSPMTYRYENGVYSFIPKMEPTTPEIVGAGNEGQTALTGFKHIQVVRSNFIDAAVLAQILGGIPIRTPEGQTYGLVDPNKMNGALTSPAIGGAGGNSAPGGANGQNSALPANLFDYLWIVNAGAYR